MLLTATKPEAELDWRPFSWFTAGLDIRTLVLKRGVLLRRPRLRPGDPDAPFDAPFHLILNLAIGGRRPEGRGTLGVDETGFPKRMRVDWVRVWQCDGNAVSDCSSTGDQAK